MRFARSSIRVRDPDASVQFYRALGFVRDPDGYRVELSDRDVPTPQDPASGGEVRPNT